MNTRSNTAHRAGTVAPGFERVRKHFPGFTLALILGLVVSGVQPAAAATSTEDWSKPFQLLGRDISPGTKLKFPFIPDRTFAASYLNTPVFVARGAFPGPTLCLTAGIHGDELNGVEVARRAFERIDPATLRGTMIVLMAINAEGVRTGNRYLSDRRDLNRAFPGSSDGGSVASLIAGAVFTKVIKHCDALVDLHTASDNRANVPQIRADLSDPAIRELAVHFGIGIVIGGEGPDGSLRREAAKAGVKAIIYEAGEPLRFEEEEIANGVKGVANVTAYLDMTDKPEAKISDKQVYVRSKWIRAEALSGGFFFPTAKLGDIVQTGASLGKVVDPLTDESFDVISPLAGEVIGMAVPQPVLPGYGLFHLGWQDSD